MSRFSSLRHPFTVLIVASIVPLYFYSNCSESFKAATEFEISSQCGQKKVVNQHELFKIIESNHQKTASHPQIRCPGFFAVIDDDEASNLAHQQKLISQANNCNEQFPTGSEPTLPENSQSKDQKIKELIATVESNNIETWVTEMSDGSQWPTRYHGSSYANTVSSWIANEFSELAGDRQDVTVQLVSHSNTQQNSVEVIIQGSDSSNEEYIILGGHLDSIHKQTSNLNPNSRSPGADDNASGIGTLLEVFRVLMATHYVPKKTLVFYGYAAEEIGLVGSQEIAAAYANAEKKVKGVMQIDMAMYSSANPNSIQFVTDYTSANLTQLATTLSENYLDMSVSTMRCGYACSDHASWTKYNYPSFMPAEHQVDSSISRIHTTNDIVDSKLDATYAAKFSQLALAFIVAMTYE